MKKFYLLLFFPVFIACKKNQTIQATSSSDQADTLNLEYAQGFSLIDYGDYKILKVKDPASKNAKEFTYLLKRKGAKTPKNLDFTEKILIPVEKAIVTSTTHIPMLELLEEENSLIGFPNPDLISSEKTRKRIENNHIIDVGENERLNTEILLSLQPELLIGFTVQGDNSGYSTLSQSGIPIVYNMEWNEKEPLGKAEWLKFFAAFYDKEKEAEAAFKNIKENYLDAKSKADATETKPKVLVGAMYKDTWYIPKADSWAAKFIADAQGDYIFSNLKGTGSQPMSFESVLDKAQNAAVWIAPGQYTQYGQLEKASAHYKEFDAFKNQQVFSYAGNTGKTGGVLYLELAPTRPDLVLKDLIHIFHPDLLEGYKPTFYRPLE